jgi:uncharacterized membrane protein YfcA
MKRAYGILLFSSVVICIAVMLGAIVGHKFLGLSHDDAMTWGGGAFAALLGMFMLANKLTYGVWIKREKPEVKAVLDAGLKRIGWVTRWGRSWRCQSCSG